MAGTCHEFKEAAMRPSIKSSFAGATMALAAFAATVPAQAGIRMGGGVFDGNGAFRGGGFGHGYRGYAGGYGHGYRGDGGYGGWGGHPAYGRYYGNCANSLWMLNPAC
jgi:hypothetical protein